MRWTPGGLSSDVEDRRGDSGGGGFGGGGLGLVGLVILAVISLVTGRNYIGAYFANSGTTQVQQPRASQAASPQENRSAQLASFVLDDAQNTWTKILAPEGISYPRAHLVLFRDHTYSDAGLHKPRLDRFIALGMTRSISTWGSGNNSSSLAHRATLPSPM